MPRERVGVYPSRLGVHTKKGPASPLLLFPSPDYLVSAHKANLGLICFPFLSFFLVSFAFLYPCSHPPPTLHPRFFFCCLFSFYLCAITFFFHPAFSF
ncbi:MAG: hypothetical protein J3R72DRAFT_450371 [Linnemannia gamsii]|nr:MAG: hypothetical protein J3R72DRAFT_450371 [Linnemannia gamsii]